MVHSFLRDMASREEEMWFSIPIREGISEASFSLVVGRGTGYSVEEYKRENGNYPSRTKCGDRTCMD